MKTRSGRLRIALAAGTLLTATALLTAATFVDYSDSELSVDGSKNTFDIVAAGNAAPGWLPTAADWQQGNPDAFRIKLTDDGSGYTMAPGSSLELRIAAKNNSPRVAGLLNLSIADPHPRGAQKDPLTGNFLDLFDQLVFTVKDGNNTLIDHVPATRLSSITWPSPLEAGDYKIVDVRIDLPNSVGNQWQLASTDIQFRFDAVNQ